MGHRAGNPFLVMLLAQALQHTGAGDEALAAVEEGLVLTDELSPAVRAEFFRIKGELLSHRPASGSASQPPIATDGTPLVPETAEACLRTAIAEARRCRARLLELRAITSLARLWAAQGRLAEARHSLATIYACFSEGFETPDLLAAQALLAELGA
jgi:adenylate cyclase